MQPDQSAHRLLICSSAERTLVWILRILDSVGVINVGVILTGAAFQAQGRISCRALLLNRLTPFPSEGSLPKTPCRQPYREAPHDSALRSLAPDRPLRG